MDSREGRVSSAAGVHGVKQNLVGNSVSRVMDCEVAVIGAGPYGLAAAAHLKSKGIEVRVFGRPMEFWADKMPAGMLLRSPRVASNISDPKGGFSLEAFETAAKIEPQAPLPLETFVAYGQWFQTQLIPDLDQREVTSLNRTHNGFELALEDGKRIHCHRVVVATGIGSFQRIPEVFQKVTGGKVSHCYAGCDVPGFANKRVAVVGAGQSALECAALLQEAGANVEVIARTPALKWIGMHQWLHKLGPVSSMLYSQHDVGPAGISRLVAAPNLVKHIPLKWRDKIRTRAVRPAGSRWLPPRLSRVKLTTGRSVREASSATGKVRLRLDDSSERIVDHVLLGTGYQVDLSRYRFLAPELLQSLATFDGYPVLKSGFESSLTGLHFIGAPAARTFGPLLYFVAGTDFAARELTSKISKSRRASR